MAVTAIAANLPRAAIPEPRDHCGFVDPRLINDFEAVATAAALPLDKARSNRRDERGSAATRLNAQPPGMSRGLLNSVAGDMTPPHIPRSDIQPQNRDFVALHLDTQPVRAPLERIPAPLLEHGLPRAGAAHGYPD